MFFNGGDLMEENTVIYQILLYVLAVNVLLTGIYNALEYIKDKTKTEVDNKLYAFLGKVITIVQKLIDAVGFNPKHK
jgi:hypothetical protein